MSSANIRPIQFKRNLKKKNLKSKFEFLEFVNIHKWRTPSSFALFLSVVWTVRSLISSRSSVSSSSWSSSEWTIETVVEYDVIVSLWDARDKVNTPLWLAGLTVIIKLALFATIMSVTWSRLLPATSIPFTSSTSSLTARRPVDSARPPGTSLRSISSHTSNQYTFSKEKKILR